MSSPEPQPIEKLMMKLCNVGEIYSVSRIWADSDKKMRIYSSASIAANLAVSCIPFVATNSRMFPIA